MIDTNVWTYLSQETDAETLAAYIAGEGHRGVINPLMLTEALRTSEVAKRDKIVAIMCSRHWRKLPGSLDVVSVDLLVEIRRHRPEWLRSIPKTDRLHSFRDYWTKVSWREAKQDPDAVAARIAAANAKDDAEAEIARVQAANKQAWPFEDGDFASAALSAATAEDHPDPDPGSRLGWPADTPVLWWRISARDVFWAHMGRELAGPLSGYIDRTMTDSLGAYVDLPTMRRDRASFNRFFLFDVEPWNVPRLWWQGTLEMMQLGAKLGSGNAMDAAHVSYLPDCDYFLTSDKRFANMANIAADLPGAPAGGVTVLVEPGANGWLDAFRAKLVNLPATRSPAPTRLLPDGPGLRVGDGDGEISAREVRQTTKRSPKLVGHEGPARLVTVDGDVVIERVEVVITNDEAVRPAELKAEYFGEFLADPNQSFEHVEERMKYVLEWLGPHRHKPTKIWVTNVGAGGLGAKFAVNGKP